MCLAVAAAHRLSAGALRKSRILFTYGPTTVFGMEKISINDIIMYVVARTLAMPEHKALNANLIDDGKTMKYYRQVNLGMAVDLSLIHI